MCVANNQRMSMASNNKHLFSYSWVSWGGSFFSLGSMRTAGIALPHVSNLGTQKTVDTGASFSQGRG